MPFSFSRHTFNNFHEEKKIRTNNKHVILIYFKYCNNANFILYFTYLHLSLSLNSNHAKQHSQIHQRATNS